MSYFSVSDVGIDLGTSTTLVYAAGQGVVLNEPSVVAVERVTGKIVAIGDEALKLTGRTPGNLTVIRPLSDGVVRNFDVTARMLRHFFEKVVGKRLVRPRTVVCVPSGVTEAEKRCVVEAALEAGARHCCLIDEPLAAAIGAGEDVLASKGLFVVDVGGGTTDIALIESGAILLSDSVRVAGNCFNDAILNYMRVKHDLSVGERSAEDIKISYGRAHVEKEQRIVELRGSNTLTGLMESVRIGTNETVDALSEPLAAILERIRALMNRLPPKLLSDVAERGILFTGGGALLTGLSDYMAEGTGVPCRIAENAVECVVRGTGKVLESPEQYRSAVFDYRRGEYFEG